MYPLAFRVHPVVLALSLLLSTSVAAVAQTVPETVELRFGWPAGTSAQVEQEWTRIRATPQRTDSIRVLSRHRMQVLPQAQGRLIRTDAFSPPQISAPGADSNEFVQNLFAQLSAFTPSFVVSPEGEFLRVEGVERMKDAVDSLFLPLLREMGEVPPQMTELLQSMLTEEALTQSAAGEWNLLVGQWHGAELELGEVYGVEEEEPYALVPGLMIPVTYEFSAAERVPCEPGSGARRCVALQMYSVLDPEVMGEAMQRFMARLGVAEENLPAEALQAMKIEQELTLIAEPGTLLPYYVEMVKYVEVETQDTPAEKGRVTRQEDRRVYRYTYTR